MNFGYTIIYVEDVAKTVEFYERCFGLTRRFVSEGSDYAEMETGVTTLSFSAHQLASSIVDDFRPAHPDQLPPGIEIAFTTDDVPQAYAKAIDNGATPLKAPVTKPWGQVVAYVRDCNGVLVELCTPIG
jgi:lactoylglutathione lyase